MITVKYVNGNKLLTPSDDIKTEIDKLLECLNILFYGVDIPVRIQYSQKFGYRHTKYLDYDKKTGLFMAWQKAGNSNLADGNIWISVPNVMNVVDEYGGTLAEGITYTLAHELGHFYDYLRKRFHKKSPRQREIFANRFADRLYKPLPQFRSEISFYEE